MRRIQTISGMLLLMVLLLWAADFKVPEDKTVIVLKPGEAAPVSFTHQAHSLMKEMTCVKCHGSIAEKGEFKRCQACHQERGIEITAEEAFHGFCVKCHKESKNPSAPVDCEKCHLEQDA